MKRAFSALLAGRLKPGALPQAGMKPRRWRSETCLFASQITLNLAPFASDPDLRTGRLLFARHWTPQKINELISVTPPSFATSSNVAMLPSDGGACISWGPLAGWMQIENRWKRKYREAPNSCPSRQRSKPPISPNPIRLNSSHL